jgi:hypothetical protein
MKSIIFMGAVCVLISACTPPPLETARAAWVRQKTEVVSKAVEDIPEWFSTPREDEAEAVYSVGTAIGPNLQLSYDRAILNAKRVLADRVDGLMSSKVKAFVAETGQNENKIFTTEAERVVVNFMAEVNVAGYALERTDIQASYGRYRVYVMLRYPLGEANDIMMLKLRRSVERNSRKRAEDAFRELDEDVIRYKQERKEESSDG